MNELNKIFNVPFTFSLVKILPFKTMFNQSYNPEWQYKIEGHQGKSHEQLYSPGLGM
jgi:hypothetical protein